MKAKVFNWLVLATVVIGMIGLISMTKVAWVMFWFACAISTISAFTVNLDTVPEE